eukprot:761512-Hanusia_phi.AAC.1
MGDVVHCDLDRLKIRDERRGTEEGETVRRGGSGMRVRRRKESDDRSREKRSSLPSCEAVAEGQGASRRAREGWWHLEERGYPSCRRPKSDIWEERSQQPRTTRSSQSLRVLVVRFQEAGRRNVESYSVISQS